MPVRGSALRGISGTIWPGRRWPSSFSRPAALLARLRLEQHAAQVLVDRDRRVAGRVDAARDAPLDLAERDLAADRERGLEAGVAGLLEVVGGGGVVERGAEHALAREVEVAAVLEHGAGDDLAGALALQAEARDEPVERGGEHVLVRGLGVRSVGAGEGDPVAAEDGDLLWHRAANVPVHLRFQSGKVLTHGRSLPAVRRLPARTLHGPPARAAAARAAAARPGPARGPGPARAERSIPAICSARIGFEIRPDAERYAAVIFDASRITRTGELRELYDFFHPAIRQLGPSGRLIVIGSGDGVAQRALEGFVRSAGKEVRHGATAQLVYASPDADLESTLRFLLSGRSAYVSGQVIRVGAAVPDPPGDWERPLAGRTRSSRAPRAGSARRSPRCWRATALTSSAPTSPPRARTSRRSPTRSAARRSSSTSRASGRPDCSPIAAPTSSSTTPASRATRRSPA